MTDNTPKHFHVNASLFAAANLMRSYNPTRYYINGVYVEPCPEGGVLLVATDGRRLIVIRDENGFTPEPVIIQVEKGELKKFKPDMKMNYQKRLVIEDVSKFKTHHASIRWIDDKDGQSTTVDILQVTRVDGTFPDWRRVVPAHTAGKPGAKFHCFNTNYVADFGKARALIGEAFGNKGKRAAAETFTMAASDNSGNPVLIGFDGYDHVAFGVLMPIRANEPTVPAWAGFQPMVEEEVQNGAGSDQSEAA